MKLCMNCMNQIEDHISTCSYCGYNATYWRKEPFYLAPGTIVGDRYILGRVLSYNGHTISYLGMNTAINHKVIIKEYLPSIFSTRSEGEKEVTIYAGDAQEQFEKGLNVFMSEAKRIQAFNNPEGIAKVYDCITQNDTGYVVSEYVQGMTLKDILDTGKKYSVQEATSFIIPILKGLYKIHLMNIIHGDISPETIVVTNSGEIKLIDFAATRYDTTDDSINLAMILKEGYAPEEQYRNCGVRGPWTDVYALAAVMYRMITGIVPQESIERALVDELKEPSKLGVSIPNNVETALMNALNVYQYERTPSTVVFLEELNNPSVKRMKEKKNNHKTSYFSTCFPILVVCLLCIVMIGGTIIVKIGLRDCGELGSNSTFVLDDFTGKEIEDVKDIMKKKGYDIEVEVVYTYNSDEQKNGLIYAQSIDPTNDLAACIDNELCDLKLNEDGKVTGTLICYVNQNNTIKYNELYGLNAYSLSQKMDKSINDIVFKKESGGDGDYFDIIAITLKNEGNPISWNDINDKNKCEEQIVISDIVSIDYCANDFFYWEELPNFVGENIDNFVKVETYEKMNESSTPVKSGNKKSLKEAYFTNCDYYTFENYNEGYIFEQTIQQGEQYDASEGQDGALLKVVKKRIDWTDMTGNKLKEELLKESKDLENHIKFQGSVNGAQAIDKVEVYSNEKGTVISFFELGDDITINIYTKESVTVMPQQTTQKKETFDW